MDSHQIVSETSCRPCSPDLVYLLMDCERYARMKTHTNEKVSAKKFTTNHKEEYASSRCLFCHMLQSERQYYLWKASYTRSSYCLDCSEHLTGRQYVSYWGSPEYNIGSWRSRYQLPASLDVDIQPLSDVIKRIDKIDTTFAMDKKEQPKKGCAPFSFHNHLRSDTEIDTDTDFIYSDAYSLDWDYITGDESSSYAVVDLANERTTNNTVNNTGKNVANAHIPIRKTLARSALKDSYTSSPRCHQMCKLSISETDSLRSADDFVEATESNTSNIDSFQTLEDINNSLCSETEDACFKEETLKKSKRKKQSPSVRLAGKSSCDAHSFCKVRPNRWIGYGYQSDVVQLSGDSGHMVWVKPRGRLDIKFSYGNCVKDFWCFLDPQYLGVRVYVRKADGRKELLLDGKENPYETTSDYHCVTPARTFPENNFKIRSYRGKVRVILKSRKVEGIHIVPRFKINYVLAL